MFNFVRANLIFFLCLVIGGILIGVGLITHHSEIIQAIGLAIVILLLFYGIKHFLSYYVFKRTPNKDSKLPRERSLYKSSDLYESTNKGKKVVNLFKRFLTFKKQKKEKSVDSVLKDATELNLLISKNKTLSDRLKRLKEEQENCYEIGCHYLNGIGFNKNYSDAFKYFYEGAKKGSLKCALELGKFYEHGKFVGRNDFLAKYWYEFAAFGGNTDAYICLAKWYLKQEPTKLSVIRIVYFLDKACEVGERQAFEIRKSLQENQKFTCEGIEKIVKDDNRKNIMYDFAIKKQLHKFIFRGGSCNPNDIIHAYKTLGFFVSANLELPDLTVSQIKKSYFSKMREYHPDANNGQNKYQDDSFEDLQTSYKLLLRLNG